LYTGIAIAFSKAIAKFATADHPLRYSWLDFVPITPKGHSWRPVYDSIKSLLEPMAVFQTRERRTFKRSSEVRYIPDFVFHNKEPLFADLSVERYISGEYAEKHREVLQGLGVSDLQWKDMLELLEGDLMSARSRLKTKEPNDTWHVSFATLFTRAFQSESKAAYQQRLKQLAIIPLVQRNQWAGLPSHGSLTTSGIYFSYTGEVPIPESIDVKLLDRDASSNSTRRRFYRALGVQDLAKETVITKILMVHSTFIRKPSQGIPQFAELRYLFHHYHDPAHIQYCIEIPADAAGSVAKNWKSWFFPSDDEYSLYQLIPIMRRAQVRDIARFLPQCLVDLEPATVCVRGRTWRSWLQELTSARTYPPLCSGHAPSDTLSKTLLAVLQYNPTRFLGTLKARWHDYRDEIDRVHNELAECKVPTTCGPVRLLATYLPTKSVLAKIAELNLDKTEFAVLNLPGATLTDSSFREWQFLEDFGVCSKPDLEFYKYALMVMSDNSEVRLKSVREVYRSMANLATIQDYEILRYVRRVRLHCV
jgi:hypothetical protein